MNPSDCIIFDNNYSSGYKLNKITPNIDQQIGGTNVSSLFKNLAVPAGLLYLQQNINPHEYNIKNTNDVIEKSLYDKLLDLASVNEKKNIKSKKHTKKHTKKIKQKRNKLKINKLTKKR